MLEFFKYELDTFMQIRKNQEISISCQSETAWWAILMWSKLSQGRLFIWHLNDLPVFGLNVIVTIMYVLKCRAAYSFFLIKPTDMNSHPLRNHAAEFFV